MGKNLFQNMLLCVLEKRFLYIIIVISFQNNKYHSYSYRVYILFKVSSDCETPLPSYFKIRKNNTFDIFSYM